MWAVLSNALHASVTVAYDGEIAGCLVEGAKCVWVESIGSVHNVILVKWKGLDTVEREE